MKHTAFLSLFILSVIVHGQSLTPTKGTNEVGINYSVLFNVNQSSGLDYFSHIYTGHYGYWLNERVQVGLNGHYAYFGPGRNFYGASVYGRFYFISTERAGLFGEAGFGGIYDKLKERPNYEVTSKRYLTYELGIGAEYRLKNSWSILLKGSYKAYDHRSLWYHNIQTSLGTSFRF